MSQDSIELILYKISELDKKIEEVRSDQKLLAAKAVCPSPGACVLLARDVEELTKREESREARVRKLETLVDRAEGVGLAAKALWAFIGAGGLGLVYAASQALSILGK
jgi:hypothetical protein